MHNVGSDHQDGLAGMRVDQVKAREWYWKAAGQDHPPSLTALALTARTLTVAVPDPTPH
jgi:TPR repeat protein